MSPDELRAQLESDLAWRLDELRHLRNNLLGSLSRDDWPASSMRTILVMQYAHLEGLTRQALTIYAEAINALAPVCSTVHPQLVAAAMRAQFRSLRAGIHADEAADVEGQLMRRAHNETAFVETTRTVLSSTLLVDPEIVTSTEGNLSPDLLRRLLYSFAIPPDQVHETSYRALDFVRRARHDIAHGVRTERIEPGLFDAHRLKSEALMQEVVRLVFLAFSDEWFRVDNGPAAVGA
ncbi:MAG: hypothetical protein KGQ66_04355 [Acidobacteriota bacterium]|nr:hypothetical protein [Acidobacteriota bacterium]